VACTAPAVFISGHPANASTALAHLRTLRSFAPFAFYLGQMRHKPRLFTVRYTTVKRKERKETQSTQRLWNGTDLVES
jgi:hypothetical protein